MIETPPIGATVEPDDSGDRAVTFQLRNILQERLRRTLESKSPEPVSS